MNGHDLNFSPSFLTPPVGPSRRPRRPSLGCERLEGRQLMSTLGQDVTKLVTDLGTIHARSAVTAAELGAVGSDLQAIAQVATRPSSSSVAALTKELQIVIQQGSITPAQLVILEKDVDAVLSTANVPVSLAEQTVSDVGAVISSSGITRSDVKLIAGDIDAIVSDLAALKR
jgi:hypothetical protein